MGVLRAGEERAGCFLFVSGRCPFTQSTETHCHTYRLPRTGSRWYIHRYDGMDVWCWPISVVYWSGSVILIPPYDKRLALATICTALCDDLVGERESVKRSGKSNRPQSAHVQETYTSLQSRQGVCERCQDLLSTVIENTSATPSIITPRISWLITKCLARMSPAI